MTIVLSTAATLKIPHFAPRELEYIKLRFDREMSLKEIAAEMKVSRSWAVKIGEIVYIKLGMDRSTGYGWGKANMIAATKRLILLGIVKI